MFGKNKNVLDDLPVIVCEFDLSLNIRYANNLAYENFGYTREDVENRDYSKGSNFVLMLREAGCNSLI